MNRASLERLKLIHPTLADRVLSLAARLGSGGIDVRVTQGLRSWNEQLSLYSKGRDLIGGKWVIVNRKEVVTMCPPGWSYHNFGLAIDVAPDDPLIPRWQPLWDDKHPFWKRIAEVAKSMGFVCGAFFRTFPDAPHLQMTGRFPITPSDEVRYLFKEGGVQAIWDESGL